MSIAKELGTRSALLMLLVITVVSVIMGGMINYLLRMLL
jgi:hypothetical protein